MTRNQFLPPAPYRERELYGEDPLGGALFDQMEDEKLPAGGELTDEEILRRTGPAINTTMPVGEPTGLEEPPAAPAPTGPMNTRETRDALGGYAPVGTMSGFRTDDYGGDTKARNSMKNTAGRILSRYGSTPEGLRQAMQDPDWLRYFPTAKLVEGGAGDQIDFGGMLSDFETGTPVGIVDVGQAFDPRNNSGGAWQWIDQANDGGAPVATGGTAAPGGGTSPLNLGGDGDLMARLLAEIQQLMSNPEALLGGAIEEQMR